MFVTLLAAVTKCLIKVTQGKVFSGSQIEGSAHYGREDRLQDLETAVHTASAFRKHSVENAGMQPTLSFFFSSCSSRHQFKNH